MVCIGGRGIRTNGDGDDEEELENEAGTEDGRLSAEELPRLT